MRIAFIGLGNMGGGMAANLVKAGHAVQAFDLSEAALKRAEIAGCTIAKSAAAAVGDAEAVVTMLPAGPHVRQVYAEHGEAMEAQKIGFDIGLLLGGQIKGQPMRLFQIYSAGNFIETTEETPFLQIGEHKYGKPILDRAAQYTTDLYDAVKLALVSMDSTLRSNLTVGLPIDLMVYKRDEYRVDLRRRITEDDAYFRNIRELWSSALRDAYRRIPRPDWTTP